MRDASVSCIRDRGQLVQIPGVLVAALIFSGLSALIYQVLWTRLLGFAFGTTTEAIGTVLAIFFGGLAIGGAVAGKQLARIRRPLRFYAWLELGIGCFALLSLPLLRNLDAIYALLGPGASPASIALLRIAGAACVLLPPTIAMGATLPVVVRGVVARDETLGRWSAFLYTANTLGAVLGAYLCGFWLLGWLGVTLTITVAAGINLIVAAVVFAFSLREPIQSLGTPAADPTASASTSDPIASGAISAFDPVASGHPQRAWFLFFFAISGFVAIGYEIVWSKVFSIVFEGTLYSFAAVLATFLLGIALGSLGIAPWIDRIRALPRAFGLVHVAIPLCVLLGMSWVSDLPYLQKNLASSMGLHSMFVLIAPIVLLPTLLFGAAFPILIRIYTFRAAHAGAGMGLANAVNTGGSIVASLALSFWAIPALGSDAVLYALLLLQLGMSLAVLLSFEEPSSTSSRLSLAYGIGALALVGASFPGAQLESAVAGRRVRAASLMEYRQEQRGSQAQTELAIEGKTALVTVHRTAQGRELRTNSMPESAVFNGPPYRALEGELLGVLPYLLSERPERALVIGFGGGGTVDALLGTAAKHIEVVELERSVIAASGQLYQGRLNPLADPRVELRINDGRYDLLTAKLAGRGPYGIIASQPSHPWLVGAANLFTEEYFELVRGNLAPGGVFALWVNCFHTDAEAVLAILASFERVFPGGTLLTGANGDPRASLILVGGLEPLQWKLEDIRQRLADPRLRQRLEVFDIRAPEDLLARIEGPVSTFAALAPNASNTDDRAFVELRLARNLNWSALDFANIEDRIPDSAPVLSQVVGEFRVEDVARTMLSLGVEDKPWRVYASKTARLVRMHGDALRPSLRASLEAEAKLWSGDAPARHAQELMQLSRAHPEDASAQRALGLYHAKIRKDFPRAVQHFEEAWRRSRRSVDAYAAARAAFGVSPAGVAEWIERIPVEERNQYPRLAFYEAQSALTSGESETEIRRHYAKLLAYHETEEGREFPGVDATLGHLARALGHERAARAFLDADSALRRRKASELFDRGRHALDAEQLEEAERTIGAGRQLAPAHPMGFKLAARLAVIRNDDAAIAAIFNELRAFAASLDAAIAAENQMRLQIGLPLLPQRSSEELMARPEIVASVQETPPAATNTSPLGSLDRPE